MASLFLAILAILTLHKPSFASTPASAAILRLIEILPDDAHDGSIGELCH